MGCGVSSLTSVPYVFQLIVWFLTFIKNALVGLFGGSSAQEDREGVEKLPDIRRERYIIPRAPLFTVLPHSLLAVKPIEGHMEESARGRDS